MEQLEITEKNVRLISSEKLKKRYEQIQRWISGRKMHLHPDILSNLVEEQEIIRSQLLQRGAGNLIAEQLEIPGLIPKKSEYEDVVISELRKYFTKKLLLKQYQGRLENGVQLIFPSGISQYGNLSGIMCGIGENLSSTEQSVIHLEERKERLIGQIISLQTDIEQMEHALEILDELERELVERKYLQKSEPSDMEVIDIMPVQKTKFYEIKKTALLKIAEVLNIL